MDDSNQIDVPPSFVALYTNPSGHRLTEPIRVVRTRYELCEDMAQMLMEQAAAAHFKSGGSEADVLRKMQAGLSEAESPVSAAEAQWVVLRIAELLGWESPAPQA
jgi:hypothetical protein